MFQRKKGNVISMKIVAGEAIRRALTVASLLLLLTAAGCVEHSNTVAQENSEISATAEPDVVTPAETDNEESLTQEAPKPLHFLFFSDTQADPDTNDYSRVGAMISTAILGGDAPGLVIFGGDTVNDGGDGTEWIDFHQSVGIALDGIMTAAVPGNHDHDILLTEQFNYPAEAHERTGAGYFYTLTMDQVFFIMLDSSAMGAADRSDIEWLRGELQSDSALNAQWRIAVMHHPMWPVAEIPKDIERAEVMRSCFLPVLEEFGIDLILCGHQHVYARTQPMQGDSEAGEGRGIVQIMVASGEKAAYTPGSMGYFAFSDTVASYLSVSAEDEKLFITGYDSTHSVIDNCFIYK